MRGLTKTKTTLLYKFIIHKINKFIPTYTYIYLHIPTYTYLYLLMPTYALMFYLSTPPEQSSLIFFSHLLLDPMYIYLPMYPYTFDGMDDQVLYTPDVCLPNYLM